MNYWHKCRSGFYVLISSHSFYIQNTQHTKDKHIQTTQPLTHLPSRNKCKEHIYKEKPVKETNTITVMCLHCCLIIKDDDKRIKCHSKDSGYFGAVSNMRSTKQRKSVRQKTHSDPGQTGWLVTCVWCRSPTEIVGGQPVKKAGVSPYFQWLHPKFSFPIFREKQDTKSSPQPRSAGEAG